MQIVMYNLITDGAIPPSPNPIIFMGEGTLIDQYAHLGGGGEEDSDVHCAVNHYFFDDLGSHTVDDIFGMVWSRRQLWPPPPDYKEFNALEKLDLTQSPLKHQRVNPYHKYDGSTYEMTEWVPSNFVNWNRTTQAVKFAYMCTPDPSSGAILWKDPRGFDTAPEALSWASVNASTPVVGFVNRLFNSPQGLDLGEHICNTLAKVPPYLQPSDRHGIPRPTSNEGGELTCDAFEMSGPPDHCERIAPATIHAVARSSNARP